MGSNRDHVLLLFLVYLMNVEFLCVSAGSVGEINVNLTIRLCSDDFCDLFKCIPLKECDGEEVKKGSVCGCCDSCVKILKEGEECGNIKTPMNGKPTSKCQAGLTCDKEKSPPTCKKSEPGGQLEKCIENRLKRQELLEKYKGGIKDNKFEFVKDFWLPDCDDDGRYKPKQCKKQKCVCMAPDGERLFGQVERADATNMTCACSLAMYHKKKEQGQKWMTSFREHCTEMGNFAELQCSEEICFCADPFTGRAISRVVKPSQKEYLTCYDPEDFKENSDDYLSRCEEQAVRENKLMYTFTRKGIHILRGESVICDLDGTFAPRQCRPQICHCTNREGLYLGSYAMDTIGSRPASMNCRCARDIHDNSQHGASYSTLACQGTGNFAPDQHFKDGVSFCVDEDGDLITQGHKLNAQEKLHDICQPIIDCLEGPSACPDFEPHEP